MQNRTLLTPLFLDAPVSGLALLAKANWQVNAPVLPGGELYIHFDVDVVSLDESPAQNYPAEGGPSAALLHAVFGRLAATGRVGAVSVAAWNPALDPIGKSQAVSMALLHTLVGSLNT